MATTSRVTIQETYELPSRGKFEGVPEKITLRAMSLSDEKQRLATPGFRGIVDLINNCTIKPEGFDANKLSQFDLDFAMLKLRIISHGSNYNVEVTCPHCQKLIQTAINLDDLQCTSVDDDFSSKFEIGPLPISGDVLTIKLLTFEDRENMESEAKRILTKFPNYKGDPEDVLTYIYMIKEVNGEALPYTKLKSYIETMPANDSIYVDQMYTDASGNYGLDTLITFECPNCGETFVRNMPMNSEFFRPRFDIAKRSNV